MARASVTLCAEKTMNRMEFWYQGRYTAWWVPRGLESPIPLISFTTPTLSLQFGLAGSGSPVRGLAVAVMGQRKHADQQMRRPPTLIAVREAMESADKVAGAGQQRQ